MSVMLIAMSNELFYLVSGWGVRRGFAAHPTRMGSLRDFCPANSLLNVNGYINRGRETMSAIPIRRIILYKHGVGYFERRGTYTGETLRLTFPRQAMDDVLKSLIALDMGEGFVRSLDFETPENREELIGKGSIHLSDNHSILDLLRDLRGRNVRCTVKGGEDIEGLVVGVEYDKQDPLRRATVALYQPQQQSVRSCLLARLETLHLVDDTASADLSYFLRASQNEEDRRSATLHLSPGEHDILLGYIAPAPAWRVSYRMIFSSTTQEEKENVDEGCTASATLLLQGWGLFDNQLDEDLDDVLLVLVAGMPISFRYRLYEPKVPERPLIEEEERTVNAPVFYDSAPPPAPAAAAPPAGKERARGMGKLHMSLDSFDAEEAMAEPTFSAADAEGSVDITASGSERGALFAYQVGHTVSVARGQSAMVPIISKWLDCRRDLLYNRKKLPDHPVASLRMVNETGLTLERGPVTIIEDSDYAGEAVVPFTRTGNEVIIPYAVEMGIKVEEKHHRERRTVSISVRDEYLLVQEYDLRHASFHITSTLSKPETVVLEYTLRPGYELTDTMEPEEQSASFVRWSVPCEANTRTVFKVHERTLQSRHERVRSLSGKQLQQYLENKFLDKATVKKLEEVLGFYRQIDELQHHIKQIERGRDTIYKQQKQIQGNLSPLGREGEEGALRKRYVTELNKLEDQLTSLAQKENDHNQKIASLEEQAQQALKKLSVADG
jgi:hypothetical protein